MSRRIRKLEGFIYYFAVSFSVLLLLFILQKKWDCIEEIQCLYSSNTVEIKLPNSDVSEIIECIEQNNKIEMKMVCEGLHPFLELKGIYYNENLLDIPIIQGRFLTSDESQDNIRKAVVGYQYSDEIYEKNKQKYYQIDGIEYEVIGVIGRTDGSRFNTMIFLPFRTAVIRYGTSGIYLLDDATGIITSKLLTRSESNIMQCNISVRKLYDNNISRFLRKAKEDNGMVSIYLSLTLIIIICSLLGVDYCLPIKLSDIKVFKILGISDWSIIRNYMKDDIVILFSTFIVNIMCGEFLLDIFEIRLVNCHIVWIGLLTFYIIMNIEYCLKVIISMREFNIGENM